MEDAKAIAASADLATYIDAVSPEYQGRTQITTAGNNANTQVVGATPTYPGIHKITMSSGNFITQNDVNSMTKVAVIGPSTRPDCDVIGSGGSVPQEAAGI